MAIRTPVLPPRTTPDQAQQVGPDSARERDHAHAGAREAGSPARHEGPGGELVAFPGAESSAVEPATGPAEGAVARARRVSARWVAEAGRTGRAALDGSVWRARPAALRDIHARTQRGEWAGGIPALYLAGRVYGWVALVLVALLYGLAEVVKRPARLAVAVLIVLAVVLAL